MRRIEESLMSVEVSCNICGSKDYTVLFPARVAQINQIVRCNACGLMYANPREVIDLDSIELMEPDWLMNHLHRPWVRQRLEKERLQTKDYKDTRAFLQAHFPRAGNLVEVGSSFGFLSRFFMESGWTVTGVDPNRGSCCYAKSEFRLNVIPSPLGRCDIQANSADVVLMMHVIEHLVDPKESLSCVYKMLKPGGVLVLETPRYDTWMFKYLGKRERSLGCNGHLYFFTSASLTELARQSGFKLIRLDDVGRSLTLDRILYNLGVILKNKTLAYGFSELSRLLRLHKFWIYINLRDMQRAYFKK